MHVRKSNLLRSYLFSINKNLLGNGHRLFTSVNIYYIQHSYQYNGRKTQLLQQSVKYTVHKRSFSFAWLDNLAITQSKIFQSLSHSIAVEKAMDALEFFHDSTHLPWWLSIILSTVILRTAITLPFAVYQSYIISKVENLRYEMDDLVKELKNETAFAIKKFKWDEKHAKLMYNRSVNRIWKELIIRENCHPFKGTVLLWVQIPLWVILSVSFRNMASMMPHNNLHAQLVFIELMSEGFLWMPNLAAVDHSLILPVTMALCNFFIVDVTAAGRTGSETKRQKYISYFFKCISIALIPIAANVPGCLVLYWTTSSVCALAQNLLLLHPKVRRTFGIPEAPSEHSTPYKNLVKILKTKYFVMKKP